MSTIVALLTLVALPPLRQVRAGDLRPRQVAAKPGQRIEGLRHVRATGGVGRPPIEADDLLVIAPRDADSIARAGAVAARLREAIDGEATFDAASFRLIRDLRVRLGPFFDRQVESSRSLILPHGADADEYALADPTLAGLLPSATQDDWTALLGLPGPR